MVKLLLVNYIDNFYDLRAILYIHVALCVIFTPYQVFFLKIPEQYFKDLFVLHNLVLKIKMLDYCRPLYMACCFIVIVFTLSSKFTQRICTWSSLGSAGEWCDHTDLFSLTKIFTICPSNLPSCQSYCKLKWNYKSGNNSCSQHRDFVWYRGGMHGNCLSKCESMKHVCLVSKSAYSCSCDYTSMWAYCLAVELHERHSD